MNPPSLEHENVQQRIERGQWLITNLNDWNSRIDGRISFISTINAAFIALTASFVFGKIKYDDNEIWALIIFGVSCIVSYFALMLTQFPNARSKNDSIFFFGTIAEMSKYDYFEKVRTMNELDVLNDINEQCYVNAEIIKNKFYWLKFSYYSSFFSLFCWIFLVLIFKPNS